MHRRFGLAVMVGMMMCGHYTASRAGAGVVDLPRYPSISPDGEEIIFSWRGDLWLVDSEGGHATRLTSHPGVESRSAWSPDGDAIAFNSDRLGGNNIFLMPRDGSEIRQITDTDRSLSLAGFSHDGEELLFHSSREGDVYRGSRPYRVSVDAGPISRLHDAFGHSASSSPDGEVFAFVRGESSDSRKHYRGPAARDIWLYEPGDDHFTRITEWEGNDDEPRITNAGTLYFLSDRDLDTVNLYAQPIASRGDRPRAVTRFVGDGVHGYDVALNADKAVVAVWDSLYTIDLSRPNARPVLLEITASTDAGDDVELRTLSREVDEAALSPDGEVMAYIAYGRVFVRDIDDNSPTRQITTGHDRCSDVVWSPDGVTLYFSSDQDGTESIYAVTVAATRDELIKRVTGEDENHAEGPDDEADESEAIERGSDDGEDSDDPDGEGDEEETDPDEKPEEKKEPHPADRWHDALRFTIEPVVQTSTNDRRPVPAPDGRHLSFQRERGDIVIMDLESGEERVFQESWTPWNEWRWSPDARWIAYTGCDSNYNWEVYIAPSDGSAEPVNITMHPDNDGSPRWSADGRILAFTSDRIGDEQDVWMVMLDRSLESKTQGELDEYFDKAGKNAKKRKPLDPREDDLGFDPGDPIELSLEDAYLRLRRVTSFPGNEGNLELMPAGDTLIFTASGGAGGDGGLFTIKWNGRDEDRIGSSASVQQLSLDGSKGVVIRSGQAQTMSLPAGKSETIDLDATIRIVLSEQASQMFNEAARNLGLTFYHPEMKGLDWDNLSQRYHDLAVRSRTSDEFAWVANRFLGELNASHLGVRVGNDSNPPAQSAGRLGIDITPEARGFRVDRVIEYGPADRGELALNEGDLITAIEFEPIEPEDTLTSRLRGTIGDEIAITVERAGEELVLLLTPHSYGSEVQLRYNDWQRHNARLVEEWSDGRIGYLHIRSMGTPSLIEFERDLYASAHGKDGLLIDVRNNGGGWTTDRVLASIMAQPHAYTVARGDREAGLGSYPQDRLFIQRYTKPVNMLCNENSFSNAEIISHAFKTLGRGTLVGQQTYGGVISTGGFRLIDGSWVRQPFRGWYLLDGTDMENNGAMPDILVEQTPEAESAQGPYGRDDQLRAAVEDLLLRIDD